MLFSVGTILGYFDQSTFRCQPWSIFRTDNFNKSLSLYDVHCGHDVDHEENKCCSSTGQELVSETEKPLKLGVTNEVILSVAHAWARIRCHF